MEDVQRTISPVDGTVYVERPFASERDIRTILEAARRAQPAWRALPVSTRAAVCARFVDALIAKTADIAREISWQMGRPVAQSPKELVGFEERRRLDGAGMIAEGEDRHRATLVAALRHLCDKERILDPVPRGELRDGNGWHGFLREGWAGGGTRR